MIIDHESTYFQLIAKLENTEMQTQRNVKHVLVTLLVRLEQQSVLNVLKALKLMLIKLCAVGLS